MCVYLVVEDALKFKEEFERCQQQLRNKEDALTTEMKKLTVEEEEKVLDKD